MDGEWTLVQRRRRYPDNWRTPGDTSGPKVKPFTPFPTSTYAQAVVRGSRPTSVGSSRQSRPPSAGLDGATSNHSSKPSSPNSPTLTTFYVSPHNPTHLRFPPSPRFGEWKNRCFICCKTGHSSSQCRNQCRCGKCWGTGHTGNRCSARGLNPKAIPFIPSPAVQHIRELRGEPGFEDLLSGGCLITPPLMPENIPLQTYCFVDRDELYFREIERLSRGVVLHAENLEFQMPVDEVARYVVHTNLVKLEKIEVSAIDRSRFLIIFPEGLSQETFIRATPSVLWDHGITFQPWTPLTDTTITIPRFKVLLDFIGVPMHLWREREIVRSVNSACFSERSILHTPTTWSAGRW